MGRQVFVVLATILFTGFGTAAYSEVTSSAKMTGCAPVGGFSGECNMNKTSVGDPQTAHHEACFMLIDNIQVAEHDEAPDTGITQVHNHTFPAPPLNVPFEECVRVCVRNTGKWYLPFVGVTKEDCRSTACG